MVQTLGDLTTFHVYCGVILRSRMCYHTWNDDVQSKMIWTLDFFLLKKLTLSPFYHSDGQKFRLTKSSWCFFFKKKDLVIDVNRWIYGLKKTTDTEKISLFIIHLYAPCCISIEVWQKNTFQPNRRQLKTDGRFKIFSEISYEGLYLHLSEV